MAVYQRIEEQLTCSVCLEMYDDPRTLPTCLHSFCYQCLTRLTRYVKEGSHTYYLQCPDCRKYSEIPENNIDRFQTAFVLNSLLEIHQLPQANAETAAPQGDLITCPVHNEQCRVFCEDCQELLCFNCAVTLHKEHNYSLVEEVYQRQLQEVKDGLSLLKGKVTEAKQSMERLCLKETEIKEQERALKEDIISYTESIIATIRQCQTEKLNQIDVIFAEKTHTLSEQKQELKQTIDQLVSIENDVEQTVHAENQHQFLQGKQIMTEVLHSVTSQANSHVVPSEEANVSFVKSSTLLDRARNCGYILPFGPKGPISYNMKIGSPMMAGRQASISLSSNQMTNPPFDSPPSISCTLTSLDTDCTTVCAVKAAQEGKHGKYHVTFTPTARGKHELTVKTDNIDAEQVFGTVYVHPSPDMRKKPVQIMRNLSKPTGVAVTNDGVVGVVENGRNCVTVLSMANGKLTTIGTDDVKLVNPHGIAFTGDFKIIVTDDHRIQIFNHNGELLFSVGGNKKGSTHAQFNTPLGIAIHPETNQIYVADCGNNRIIVFNEMLKSFSHKFGLKGSTLGSFNRPTDLAFSSKELFVVNQGLDCIDVFSLADVPVRRIGLRGEDAIGSLLVGCGELRFPTSLAIDAFNNIYVSETSSPFFSTRVFHDSRISVYQTNGCFVRNFSRKGMEESDLHDPCGLAIDKDGQLYVCDTKNNRLVIY